MRNGTLPSICVVIPCFNNSADLLCEAIESALAQDYPVREIVLIDDGSADPRPARQAAQCHDIVRLIRHPRNRGGCAARNSGITAARADLIAFLDADDVWLPEKLSRQVAALAKSNGGDFSRDHYCASNCFLEHGNRRRPANAKLPTSGAPIWRYFMEEGGSLQTSTLLVPAALAKRVQFQLGLPRHQDWDFLIRMQAEGGILTYLPECLSVYRLHDDPGRVSRNPKAAWNSVIWFRQMAGSIPAKTMQRYFFAGAISRNALKSPGTLARAVLGVVALSPSGALQAISEKLLAKSRGFTKASSMPRLRNGMPERKIRAD